MFMGQDAVVVQKHANQNNKANIDPVTLLKQASQRIESKAPVSPLMDEMDFKKLNLDTGIERFILLYSIRFLYNVTAKPET